MADKIRKLLAKLAAKEREIVKLLIMRLKLDGIQGLDIKQLQGYSDLFYVCKGQLRIVYRKIISGFSIIRIDRRSEKTSKDVSKFYSNT